MNKTYDFDFLNLTELQNKIKNTFKGQDALIFVGNKKFFKDDFKVNLSGNFLLFANKTIKSKAESLCRMTSYQFDYDMKPIGYVLGGKWNGGKYKVFSLINVKYDGENKSIFYDFATAESMKLLCDVVGILIHNDYNKEKGEKNA